MQLLKCSILIGRTRLDERKFVFLCKNKNCFRRVDINQKNLCFRDFGFLATWINTSYFVLCTNRFSLIFFFIYFSIFRQRFPINWCFNFIDTPKLIILFTK